MLPPSPAAALYPRARLTPEAAELPMAPRTRETPGGGRWHHFATGDRVLVFDEPDPATGWSAVRRGTVTESGPESIEVDFGAAGQAAFTTADRIRISHVAGSCRCVVALP
ncbi:hypothetical protein ABZ342_34800 [Amycolatopsis sp. NPDC005961]|uniref:hypothetical protein n=1 Tax=Amycolatopsis sp. NPDC005961 TaxID=3156720 RepID=UPI0033CBE3B9